jgi:hypothetical protein
MLLGPNTCMVQNIIWFVVLREKARGINAIAVILAKNNFKSNLLSFLRQKYQTTPRLLGIMKILQHTNPKSEIQNTLKILKVFNQKELPADEVSIKQNLELYRAM